MFAYRLSDRLDEHWIFENTVGFFLDADRAGDLLRRFCWVLNSREGGL